MKTTFSSSALQANLARTNQPVEIPPRQLWLAELASTTWAIQKRIEEFLVELNHSFRNEKHVVELLHSICLTDFWFYCSLDEADEALTVLLDIFCSLFDTYEKEDARELLITTFLQFMERLGGRNEYPQGMIDRCFTILERDMEAHEVLYIRNSGYFRSCFEGIAQHEKSLPSVERLTTKVLDGLIDYWEETTKAEEWFASKRYLFVQMDAGTIEEIGHPFFMQLRRRRAGATTWDELHKLMFYNDIANYFRNFCKQFESSLETIYYLYYLLHLPGMANLYDHLLYDINRNLHTVFNELESDDISSFLDAITREFHELKDAHTRTVLDCVATLGKELLRVGSKANISEFVHNLVRLGFSYPGQVRVDDDWQVRLNSNHVKNIRVFLELAEENPPAMRELLNALIVELKLGGIHISDTDLFQRDVTKLLNCNVAPVYREVKQLSRIFPVFFKEIGAEGRLREVTTAIDQLSNRRGLLTHFLRVQIHVESNNTNIDLTRRIIQYWYDGDKTPLQALLPNGLYSSLTTDDEWYAGAHTALQSLCRDMGASLDELFAMNIKELARRFGELYPAPTLHQTKVLYAFEILAMILEKYSFESEDIVALVEKTRFFDKEAMAALRADIDAGNDQRAIGHLYELMRHLKSVILDPEKSEAFEIIEYKRHIAAGIPSTYGQYTEPKFDALGLTYRLEQVVSKLMERLIGTFSHEYITGKTLRQTYDVLLLFKEGLALDGIYDQQFESHLDMVKYSLLSPSFSLSQYVNLFHFIAQDVSQIIKGSFLSVYERSLNIIVPQMLSAQGIPEEEQTRERIQMEAEKFYRDILSSAFLVQQLDSFITNTVSALHSMIDNYSDGFIENMLTYDPDLTFSQLYKETERVDNPVFLGAKAFFLKKLCRLGYPVPPGFVITTEAFRHLEAIARHPYMQQDFDKAILRHIRAIEPSARRDFNNPQNPLLLSVRSGSFISLPGAMKTFLNIGMNDDTAEAMSQWEGWGWTAWDCYRRFLQSWGMAFGIDRDEFDRMMQSHKAQKGVELKIQFTPDAMRELALKYKEIVLDHGIEIETHPLAQLKTAIRCVLDSWYSASSASFRNHMQIAEEWGSAVLVQKMVLGNKSPDTGTGVAFTSSPLKDYSSINLYGDFAICSQGEDIVSGLVSTLPISESQRKTQYNDPLSLETAFPEIYATLLMYARRLIEEHGFAHQEIEFTFDSRKPEGLYILQTRNQNIIDQKQSAHFAALPHEMGLVGHGIGIGHGVLSGVLAFGMEDMDAIKKATPEARIILVRPDTVPDDIPMLFKCDGLITAKGGVTSHAAVTAERLGKVCLVKCRGLQVDEAKRSCTINGHEFFSGQPLSIDAALGNVYEGNYDIIEY